MKIKYKPNSKGYIVILRNIQKLLKDKKLSLQTIGAYILFSFNADWDKKHPRYRAILPDDKDLARLWGKNSSTIYRNRIKLIETGLLEQKEGITYYKNLDLFKIETVKIITKNKIENSHLYYAKPEKELARMMFGIAKTHKNRLDETLSL